MEFFESFFHNFFLAFIPLFVAFDVVGIVPIYLSMTQHMTEVKKKTLVTEATLTCFVVAVVFIWTGKFIFRFLGITENDFRIGGGIVLLVLAINDLIFSKNDKSRRASSDVGVVPIGIPLIMGPAALTTIIIVVDTYGYFLTFASLIVNLAFVWICFRYSRVIVRLLGKGGSRAFAKIASLFLAAIAVMMIRVGITHILIKPH